MKQQLILLILLSAFGLTEIQAQFSPVMAGGTITGSTGRLHQTFGQVVYKSHSGGNGQIGQGIQRPLGRINSNLDTVICSGDTLPAFEANYKGGTWVVQSSIGTSIDQTGKLTLGTNSTAKSVADTVVYNFNGFTDHVYVFSSPNVSLACTDLTLTFDGDGVVHLDSAYISQVIPAAVGPVNADLIPSAQSFFCSNGFEQEVSFSNASCGDSCTVKVTLLDTISPAAACESNTEELVLVWQGLSLYPASISGSSTDNCGAANLEFSFSPDFTEPSLKVSCQEQLSGEITLYMRDQSGNVSSCTVAINFDYLQGEDCGCDWGNLKLKGEIPPDDYKAKESIVATGKITMGDTVQIKAGEYITFGPGFQVSNGSILLARIDACGTVPGVQQEPAETMVLEDTPLRGAEDSGAGNLFLGSLEVFPNPFSDWFRIQFALQTPGRVSFELHNLQGGKVYHLLEEVYFDRGIQELLIDGTRLAPGVFVLTAVHEGNMVSRQMVKI